MAERNNGEVPPIALQIGSKGNARTSFSSVPNTPTRSQSSNQVSAAATAAPIVESLAAQAEPAQQQPTANPAPVPIHQVAPAPRPPASERGVPAKREKCHDGAI